MASPIPGYSYDVFISYRHKDNAYDQWVTTFADNLRKELAASFKEDVTLYFDQNPADGLQSYHDVDGSLREKVKCRIFLPVLSRTYCDEDSFAWKHELIPFLDFVRTDKVGLLVNCGHGNLASRVLPVRIHELDPHDIALYQKVTGVALRPIDLIYKAPGVDRPLRMTDEQLAANQERTIYRDQLNKVAIAIRSIMEGIQRTQQALPERKTEGRVRSLSGGRLWVTVLGMMLLLTALGTYLWRTYKATESQTGLTKNTSVPNAIAVLPFTNLANDPAQEYFSDGITEQIITELAQLRNLKVIARTSVMKFKATTRSIKEIGQELNVTHVLEGSIRRYGDRIRITAQLIDVSDESHLWAADYDEPFGDILVIQDAVSARIAKTLEEKLTSDEISSLSSQQLTHPEAYEHYLKGIYIHDNYYFSSRKDEHMRQSEKEFRAALKLEPQYVLALAGLGDLYDSYYGQGNSVSYREKRDSLATLAYALDQRLWYTRLLKALTFYDAGDSRGDVSDSAFHYFKLAYQAAPNNTKVCDQFAIFFQRIGLWYDCLPFLNKSIELNPLETTALNWRGYAYSQLGQNTVAEVDFRRSIKIDQDAIDGYVGLAMVKVFRKEADSAAHYIERAKKINADDYLLQYAESIVIANRRDKRALAVNKNQYGLILLGMYKEAVEVLANDPTQYEFIRDNPFYEPLRDREDYKQMMSELKVSYEVNKQRFKFAPTSDD